MEFYKHPDCFGTLRNLYWFLRMTRKYDEARRRKYYRRILKEKNRLYCAGHAKEHVRLYCLLMINPKREERMKRLQAYEFSALECSKLMTRIGVQIPAISDLVPVKKPVREPSIFEHTSSGIRLRFPSPLNVCIENPILL